MNIYDATEQAYKNGYEAGIEDALNPKKEKTSITGIIVWIVFKLLSICLISGTLGLSDISFTDWQFWLILSGAYGLFACGALLKVDSIVILKGET